MFIFSLSLLLVLLLVLLLLSLSILLSNNSLKDSSREEASGYECGFEQNSVSRIPLSIRYFMLTLVFLIFDMEIMLLLFSPLDMFLGINPIFLQSFSVIFLFFLFLGLLYEWMAGALDWVM